MARDIAQRFNHLFGQGKDFFVLPEAVIAEDVATLPGLDGRKMSKSYNNTVPLFEGGARALKSAVAKIVTDSRGPGEPKDAEASHLYLIYKAFAQQSETAAFRQALETGMGWGDAKQKLCERIEQELGPMRDSYEDLMAHPNRIEDILQEGARKGRAIATPFIQELRQAVGLRTLATQAKSGAAKQTKGGGKGARFVSFRDDAGQFRFRFLGLDGTELFSSVAFADPKMAGAAMRALQSGDLEAMLSLTGELDFSLTLDGAVVATGVTSVSSVQRSERVEALRASLRPTE
jgi:tryptophanyl-tRNA synthetase